MSTEENGAVLLDDGEYFVQHNVNYPVTVGHGFLIRRCLALVATLGVECVGSYELRPDGTWRVELAAPYSAETDSGCRVLGRFEHRLDALHALWRHRHEAFTRRAHD